jgi:uncharacterized membrane protein
MSAILAYSVPLHPSVVHFPIVLLFVYAVLEVLAVFSKKDVFSRAALVFLLTGVVTLVAAAITGNYTLQSMQRVVGGNPAMEHESIANITVWFFIFWTIVRVNMAIKQRKDKPLSKREGFVGYISALMAFIGCVLIFVTAMEGGELVFKKGIGTEMMQNQSSGIGK